MSWIPAYLTPSDVAFCLTIRGGVTGSKLSGLNTVSFIECSDFVELERCTVVPHHPPRNVKHRKVLTQYTDDRG